MGWSLGWDHNWKRDIGYGVPAFCDHPGCTEKIDRGLAYVCGGEPYGGAEGCGLHFCEQHLWHVRIGLKQLCERCADDKEPFEPKPDHPRWLRHKLTHSSWQRWREENPDDVAKIRALMRAT